MLNCRFVSLLLGNRRCHGNHFVLHSLEGVFLMLASRYELVTTTQY